MPTLTDDAVDSFAERLDQAALTVTATPQLTAEAKLTLVDAYRVQRAGVGMRKLRGDSLVGMKMGLTSRAKMQQMGVDVPIYGHLTSAMILDDGGAVRRADHIHPRVEPEVAFLLGRDLRGPVTSAQAMLAVDGVCCALELIDSRYQDFKFTLEDVVADNASSSRFVLGPVVRARDFDCGNVGMVMSKNGEQAEIGSSAAIYDHPALSLAALVNMLAQVGEGLSAGAIVLAGGATAAVALDVGDRVSLKTDGLGTCALRVT